MNDIELLLDSAQAMEAYKRPERARQLRALAKRLSKLLQDNKPAQVQVIDGLPDDVMMLVSGDGQAVKFVIDD